MSVTLSRQQLLSSEEGAIYKIDADIRVALAYPNTYYVAMSNLGWQLVYALINKRSDSLCERVCLPDISTKTYLSSLESNIPLNQFDIVGFSVSFEHDYLNLLKMLELGGIELEKNKRDEQFPLVIAGGVCAFMNPEPLADFIDAFVLGEAEEVLYEFIDTYKTGKQSGESKESILYRLAKIPGIYVPQFYQVAYRPDGKIAQIVSEKGLPGQLQVRVVQDLNNWTGNSQLFSPHTEFNDTCLVELSRGCARRCYFCLLGSLYQPYRPRGMDQISDMVNKAQKLGKKIGLLGAAASDYPYLDKICRNLDKNLALSISSLRADSLASNLLQTLFSSGQKSVTLAPEAGSERLRTFINKGLSENDILGAVNQIAAIGFLNFKLYFMLGLPSEESGDVQAIIELCLKIKEIVLKHARSRGKMGRIVLSISSFVPKPHTPFQWLPMEREKNLKDKLKFIKKSLAKEGNIKVLGESPRQAFIQGLLSRGDRRMGKLLLEVYKLNGNWKKGIKATGISPDFYLYRQKSIDEILPWQFLQSQKLKTYLHRLYKIIF